LFRMLLGQRNVIERMRGTPLLFIAHSRREQQRARMKPGRRLLVKDVPGSFGISFD